MLGAAGPGRDGHLPAGVVQSGGHPTTWTWLANILWAVGDIVLGTKARSRQGSAKLLIDQRTIS